MSRVLQFRVIALVLALALVVAACGGDGGDAAESGSEGGGASSEEAAGGEGGGDGLIAVLLPDSASSDRWETDDRPAFEAAFEELGLTTDDYQILNAEGDPTNQQTQAEQAITNGATVLVLTNLDSGSGATIIDNAKSQDVAVVDYDRLTLEGDADYYVSFDNEAVGRLQGETLVQCVEDQVDAETPRVAVLNGSPDDNNATLFKNGYDGVINPLFESGEWEEVDDQAVPDWDNQQALVIMEQMLTAADNQIDAVLAANDGLGNAAIQALRGAGLEGVPVTGQDATVGGIQNIVAGDQCMTVYKAITREAQAAAELAVALRDGEQPEADATVDNGTKEVPSVLLEPVAVTIDNITDTVIADGFRTVEEICTGDFAQTQWCQDESGGAGATSSEQTS
ncbi:MAG TPA: substrate-binding domain-containing protein [Euzebyales bacterium]|nr:substrate-binding domain-containing protein [Euzebyales bacterium]